MQDVARRLGLGDAHRHPAARRAAGPGAGRRPSASGSTSSARRRSPTATWCTGDNVNLAIGQGEIAVTPLQLANAYAAFANGGTLVPAPRRGARSLDPQSRPVADLPDRAASRQIDLPAGVATPILAGLQRRGQPTEGHRATPPSPASRWRPFPVAGKTGTAQVAAKQDTALFVAFGAGRQARSTSSPS